jgi:hypothetical protein
MSAGWRESHHDEDLSEIRGRRFSRTLFATCRFEDMRGAHFEHCCFIYSKIQPRSLSDILGVTLTLDCFTFDTLEFNELGLDAILYLLTMTKGNDEKREIIKRLISPDNATDFAKLFAKLEQWK